MTANQSSLERLADVLPPTAAADTDGELTIGGCRVSDLAAEFGTPLHIYDEASLRHQMRALVDGLHRRWPNSEAVFASKSAPILAIYAIAASEGMGIDVAGPGELELALAAGVSPELIHLHGNAKTDAELARAIEVGVGVIIVDNEAELDRLERLVPRGRRQKLLFRVMPGVDAKTHANMNTGGNDSKFGLPISVVSELIQHLAGHDRLEVAGVHVHIGSQILSVEQFASAVEALKPLGGLAVYDLGGGLGIAHHEGEQAPSVDDYLDTLIGAAERYLPADARILIEPGRSTVARSGVTAYRTVVTKETGRTFVAVDGGMADFVEVALTGQRFSALVANRATAVPNSRVQLVGRQCESGDLLIDQAELPDPRIDDVIVIPATGAYTYTMTNNYNGAARPAVVFVKDGEARLAVRRETTDDLLRLHQPALDHDWATSAVPAAMM